MLKIGSRAAATTIYQALIEAELSSVIGAMPHERADTRVGQRNGQRPKTLSTTGALRPRSGRHQGDIELRRAVRGSELKPLRPM
jgi:transposase-like protein